LSYFLKLGASGILFYEVKRELNGRNGGNNLSANLTFKNSHHGSRHHHSPSSSSSDETHHKHHHHHHYNWPPVITTTTCNDANLNLRFLCKGCTITHIVANPYCQQKYIECNGGPNNDQNIIQQCRPGLIFDSNMMTCNYAGLVNN
jgi:hypothetical protein